MALFASLTPASAQAPHVSFGAIGGVRLSEGISVSDESRLYTVGPTIEARFGDHMAVEFNALYKRLGSASFVNDPLHMLSYGLIGGILLPTERLYYSAKSRVHSWEFPVLGKYYFGSRSRTSRFFVQTGYSFQRGWVRSSYIWTRQNIQTGETTDQVLEARFVASTAVGAVFGGGLARRAGPLTFAPTFRYTRWGVRSDGANRNQAEFLLGVRF